MIQYTHNDLFSDSLDFLLDGLCWSAPKTNHDREQCEDDNSVSEDRTDDTGFRIDLPAKFHYMSERHDESCSMRESPRPSSPSLSLTKSYDGTQVTAALTWMSSCDINDDFSTWESSFDNDDFSTKMNYESNSIFRSDETSGVNSIFRPTQDYDVEERREQHPNLVGMKQASYQLEEPAPANKKMKQEAHRQFSRRRPAEQHSEMRRALEALLK
jgi:hypothetical protein